VRSLVEEENVDAILGGYSSDIVEAQAQMASSLGIPYVNGGGASSNILYPPPFFFFL
jgi:branched-chain amino acid transport system substrate-binding protein